MEDEEGPGVPEWVVTYGDMMSLLLTFFIMLVSLSEVDASDKYRAILQAFQEYFGYRSAILSPPGSHFPLNSFTAKLDQLGSFKKDGTGPGGIKVSAPRGKDVQIYRTREGNSLKVGQPVFFIAGKVGLSDEARKQLSKISQELAGKPNKIEVRSHSAPIHANTAHDELVRRTYQHGKVVMLYLEQTGVAHKRFRVTAAADSDPPPDTGDHRLMELDRVEVLLLDAFSKDFVGPSSMLD